jgi:Flp pilus assembly pilin Flp
VHVQALKRVRSRRGQGFAEYGLIMGLVAVLGIMSTQSTGTGVSTLIQTIANAIDGAENVAAQLPGYFSNLVADYGFAYTNNPDGSVTINDEAFFAVHNLTFPGTSYPTTLTLTVAPGTTPPIYVAIDQQAPSGWGMYAYYDGTSVDGSGNPVYTLINPHGPRPIAQNDQFQIFVSNQYPGSGYDQTGPSTVTGFSLGF